jgi:hypothetical protein
MHRPQTGNCRRKLTASSGASGFAISGRRFPLFRRSVNSRKPKAIIRISASVGATRRSLCRPRRSRDFMRTTSSWPPRLTAYSFARPRRDIGSRRMAEDPAHPPAGRLCGVNLPRPFVIGRAARDLATAIGEDKRENNSAHPSLARVFTQPGSEAAVPDFAAQSPRRRCAIAEASTRKIVSGCGNLFVPGC